MRARSSFLSFYDIFKCVAVLSVFVPVAGGSQTVNIDEVIRDFKVTLMHFSEPFLNGAKVGKYLMEGDTSVKMTESVIKGIDGIERSPSHSYDDLDKFKKYLSAGIGFTKTMAERAESVQEAQVESGFSAAENRLKSGAENVQRLILDKFRTEPQLIIPSGWCGHAIALIISCGSAPDTFDLTVVNTGDGVEFHFNTEDPNGVYPTLSQIWIEFKGIPKEEIFPRDAWFIKALILIKLRFIESQMGRKNLKVFFYNVILGNFKEYLVETPDERNRLIPMQRSGSCTLSSLMGSLLYLTDSIENFYFYRLQLGHSLIQNLLKNAQTSDRFKEILSDGLHIQGRHLFNGLASSLALQVLQYLESVLPDHFKHAGLVGSSHSSWLSDKKSDAIELLQNSHVLPYIKTTVKICHDITNFLKENPITSKSNAIALNYDESRILSKAKNSRTISSECISLGRFSTFDATRIIEDTPYRTVLKTISTFDDLRSAMSKVENESVGSHAFFKLLDIFKVSFGGDAEKLKEIIEQVNSLRKLEDMLNICDKILNNYASHNRKYISLDEILVLGVLQRLAWELTVRYDNLLHESEKIGFGELLPPQTLQKYIKYALETSYVTWSVFNTFEFQNYVLFKDFLSESQSFHNIYNGPEDLFSSWSMAQRVSNITPQPTDLKMMEHRKVQDIRNRSTKDFTGLSDVEIKYIIVLTERDALFVTFSHYYKLMNILSKLRQCVFAKKSELQGNLSREHWVSYDPNERVFKLAKSRECPRQDSIPSELRSLHDTSSPSIMFYDLIQTKTSSVGLANFEVWLNFIDNATTAKIFDSSKFQYVTNSILTVPKKDERRGEIFKLDNVAASRTISQLKRLIKMTLEPLGDTDKFNVSYTTRKRWVERAVNISVLLTRFINRIDAERILSADDCAKALAELYNLILPYCKFEPIYRLQDAEISRINFALSHICFIKIRNSKTFMEKIKLNLGDFNGIIYRKTLERYHWFVANMYYVINGSYDSVADDQFRYGTTGSPLAPNETEFLQALLKSYFLQGFDRSNSEFDDFKYHFNGYTIKISSSKHENYIILNLWSGKVIQNGTLLLDSSLFLNSSDFSNFFKQEDFQQARKGFVLKYGDKVIYHLPNFKGAQYLLLLGGINSTGSNEVKIYRKYGGIWYKWQPMITEEDKKGELEIFKYQWTDNSKFFRNTSYLVLFRDNECDPFIRFKTENNEVFLELPHFDNEVWLLMKFENDIVRKEIVENTHIGSFDLFANIAKEDDRLIFICTGYRFSEDLRTPLILQESDQKTHFDVLSVPGMTVCADQTLSTGTSLRGALVAEKDGKKMLLVPLAKEVELNQHFYQFINDDFVLVQKIPLIKDVPAPQSRLDRLLLAYTFMRNHNFVFSREFLNPNTSIHQNESFSNEELAVMSWIAQFNSELLEVIALKLMILVHYEINRSKFPLEYESTSSKSFTKFVSKIREISQLSWKYMFSIREIPEKYHIHRIFPEVLSDIFFERIFKELVIRPSEFDSSKNSRTYVNIENNLQLVGISLNAKDLKALVKYTKRKNESDEVFEFGRRLFLWESVAENMKCLFDNPKNYLQFCFYQTDPYDKVATNLQKLLDEKPELFENCTNTSTGIDFNAISKSTDPDTIRITLLKSLTTDSRNNGSERLFSMNEIKHKLEIDQSILDAVSSLRTKLLDAIKSSSNDSVTETTYFSIDLAKSSVLEKLNQSISDYIKEKGNDQVASLNIQSDRDEIQRVTDQISNLIENLKELETNSATELGAKVNFELENLDDSSKVFEFVLRSMHQRKCKTFESLYKCILEQDPASCIHKKFPQLNLETCRNLVPESFVFFQRKTLIRYFEMILRMSQKLLSNADVVPIDDLMAFCDELSKAEHFNSRYENPVIVNFEFRAKKYFVRPEQVNDIKKLTNTDEATKSFKSIVIQRMMAAGKTLVLGTNSIVTKALKSSQNLSILVPPSSLYQSNTTAMQSRTYNLFKKQGKIFMFNRFGIDETLSHFLDSVINIVEDVMVKQNYLILSPDSLQSFLNSYIEALLYGDVASNLHQEILKKYAKIYCIFKEKSSIILDEIDMTMDPKKELNFPSRESEPYNMTAVKFIADIVEFILFDPEIVRNGLNIYLNSQASLTSNNFETCRNLIFSYIEQQLGDENSIWYQLIIEKIRNTPNASSIMEFLRDSDMTAHVNCITSIYRIDKSIANALIIIKTQLHQHMKDALKGTVNFNYGPAGKARPQIKFAVPYVAANTPSSSSVFADRWETLLKTLIMVCATPCSEEIAKEVIKYATKAILHESSKRAKLCETPTYKTLQLLIPSDIDPLDLDRDNEQHVSAIHVALSTRSPAAIRILLSYYITEVFSEMTFPVVQITSNALNMTSMFNSVQGYSGTIDNVNILPQETVAEAYEDHLANEKHNGGISLKLIKDASEQNVPELNESFFAKNIRDMIFELLENFKDDPISAIIDTGAFFKMFKNQQVSKAILEKYKDKDVVLYYDEHSNQLEFIKQDGTVGFLDTTDPEEIKKATGVELGKRFTFYDQRHITGSDILQPINAHAVMTVGPRVLLRDILQGTLRMRQFMRSQQVHLVTTDDTKRFYTSKIGAEQENPMKVSDLLALGCINEDEKQEHENQKLAFIKIDAEIRSFILYEISQRLSEPSVNNDQFENIAKLMQDNKNLFIRLIRENPLSWLIKHEEQNTIDALNDYARVRLEPLRSLGINGLSAKIDQMKSSKSKTDSLLHYLGDNIRKTVGIESGTEVQMEVQAETNIQAELNIENLIITISTPLNKETYISDDITVQLSNSKNIDISSFKTTGENLNFSSLSDLYLIHLAGSTRNDLVSNTLLTKGDLIGITQDLCSPYFESSGQFIYDLVFSRYSLEGSHFLIDEFTTNTSDNTMPMKKLRVILLSIRLAKVVQSKLASNISFREKFWLCDLAGSITSSPRDYLRGKSIFEQFPQVSSLIFDLLVFNGSLPQILSNPILKHIYYKIWLNDENHSKNRATFVLLRMKLLAEKQDVVFEDDDKALATLKLFAAGKKPILDKKKTLLNSEGYDKGFINTKVHEQFMETFKLSNQNSQLSEPIKSQDVDHSDALKSFFGQEITSNQSVIFNGTTVPTNSGIPIDANSDTYSDTQFVRLSKPKFEKNKLNLYIAFVENSLTETSVDDDGETDVESDVSDTESGSNASSFVSRARIGTPFITPSNTIGSSENSIINVADDTTDDSDEDSVDVNNILGNQFSTRTLDRTADNMSSYDPFGRQSTNTSVVSDFNVNGMRNFSGNVITSDTRPNDNGFSQRSSYPHQNIANSTSNSLQSIPVNRNANTNPTNPQVSTINSSLYSPAHSNTNPTNTQTSTMSSSLPKSTNSNTNPTSPQASTMTSTLPTNSSPTSDYTTVIAVMSVISIISVSAAVFWCRMKKTETLIQDTENTLELTESV